MEPEKTPRKRAEDLITLLVPDWRPTARQGLWATRIAIVLGVLIAIGYAYGITLWEWVKLLIVPAAIAGAGLWFNQQQRKRELAAEKRAQEKVLFREFRRELLQAYNEVKKVKRMLRSAKQDNDEIDAKIYADQMEELNGVQLRFEFLREAANGLFPKEAKIPLPNGDTTSVHTLLGTAENYLKEIVEEDTNNKSEKGSKRISKLSGLQDFIREHAGPQYPPLHERIAKNGPRFAKEVHSPVHNVSTYVLTELLSEEVDEKQRKNDE